MEISQVTVVILAGGQGKRLHGQDKGLYLLQQRPMIEHVLARLQPQIEAIVISANRHINQYQHYGFPVISDRYLESLGPLSGLHSAFYHCATPYIITVPCDTPRLPRDYIQRMIKSGSRLRVASTDGRIQPTFSLVHRDLALSLQTYLDQGHRAVGQWLRDNHVEAVDFSDRASDFINLNCVDELYHWEQSIERF